MVSGAVSHISERAAFLGFRDPLPFNSHMNISGKAEMFNSTSRGNGVEFSAAKESLQEQIDVYAEKYDFVRTFITLFLHEDITRISVDEQSMSKCHETG